MRKKTLGEIAQKAHRQAEEAEKLSTEAGPGNRGPWNRCAAAVIAHTADPARASLGRLRRIQAGERHRTVYGFDDEEMDEFMYRMLENKYVADLKAAAGCLLSAVDETNQLESSP